MISGALCPTHGSSNLHFIQVTAPDNDVDNEVIIIIMIIFMCYFSVELIALS